MVSKALVVGAYQRKCEELASLPGVDLTVLAPESWQEPGGRRIGLERAHERGYRLLSERLAFNGHFHMHYYPRLGGLTAALRPDILHMDEEPYNLATWLALQEARRAGARFLFFTWQNLYRPYPPPWGWLESAVLKGSHWALAGNAEAVDVLRRKGYKGQCALVPQFGVDPAVYRPLEGGQPDGVFTVGYLGRLVEEKGLLVLLRALARLDGEWRLEAAGQGPLAGAMRDLAGLLGISGRVTMLPPVASAEVPALLNRWDCLALPSLTRPNWKEQFGRVLMEAMACQVPVVGSSSGEIPSLVGDAGLIAREGDAAALAECLARLRQDPALRASLGLKGRARVMARYTQRKIAEDTFAVYQAMMGNAGQGEATY
jgi:glycosyltransferase involved in cell wall biosynthesis